jgi:hypothetical protein
MSDLLERPQKLSNQQTQDQNKSEDQELEEMVCKCCSVELDPTIKQYLVYHFSSDIKIPMCAPCIHQMHVYEQLQTAGMSAKRRSRMR